MHRRFQIAGGSIPGHMHVAAGRNNQDAYGWDASEAGLVAVVCDGCSGGAHSELGARLGARLIVQAASRRLAAQRDAAALLAQVYEEVVDTLRRLASQMSPERRGGCTTEPTLGYTRTITDHFLFTVVGVVLASGQATPFALGDGLIVLNGEHHVLGPYPDNQPPYLGYALLPPGGSRGPCAPAGFAIHRSIPLAELASLLLGTDGTADLEAMAEQTVSGRDERVGPLSQFWTEDRFFANPDMVRRRLTIVNRGPRGGLLADDTTLVVVRPEPAEA